MARRTLEAPDFAAVSDASARGKQINTRMATLTLLVGKKSNGPEEPDGCPGLQLSTGEETTDENERRKSTAAFRSRRQRWLETPQQGHADRRDRISARRGGPVA